MDGMVWWMFVVRGGYDVLGRCWLGVGLQYSTSAVQSAGELVLHPALLPGLAPPTSNNSTSIHHKKVLCCSCYSWTVPLPHAPDMDQASLSHSSSLHRRRPGHITSNPTSPSETEVVRPHLHFASPGAQPFRLPTFPCRTPSPKKKGPISTIANQEVSLMAIAAPVPRATAPAVGQRCFSPTLATIAARNRRRPGLQYA